MFVNETFENIFSSLSAFRVDDNDHDHDDNCPLSFYADLRDVDTEGDLNCGTNSVNNVLQVSASGNCVEKFKNKLVEKAICLSLTALTFFSSLLPFAPRFLALEATVYATGHSSCIIEWAGKLLQHRRPDSGA